MHATPRRGRERLAAVGVPGRRSDPRAFGPRPRRGDEIPRRPTSAQYYSDKCDRLARSSARLLQRLQAIAWWRAVMRLYPGGVVPLGAAGRVMGVSRRRMGDLVSQGRIPIVEGMPGGGRRDRFVPVDALIGVSDDLYRLKRGYDAAPPSAVVVHNDPRISGRVYPVLIPVLSQENIGHDPQSQAIDAQQFTLFDA